MEPLEFHTVNAFVTATTPHSGSQAAVVLIPPGDPRASDDTYLLALASDFAWPATAFVTPLEDGEVPKYAIRWFTQAGVSRRVPPVGLHSMCFVHG